MNTTTTIRFTSLRRTRNKIGETLEAGVHLEKLQILRVKHLKMDLDEAEVLLAIIALWMIGQVMPMEPTHLRRVRIRRKRKKRSQRRKISRILAIRNLLRVFKINILHISNLR